MQNQQNSMKQSRENDQNPVIWRQKGHKIFFSKIGLRHFSRLIGDYLHAKNLRNPMMGSIRTFVTDGTTCGRTDRHCRLHRTRRRKSGSKKVKNDFHSINEAFLFIGQIYRVGVQVLIDDFLLKGILEIQPTCFLDTTYPLKLDNSFAFC